MKGRSKGVTVTTRNFNWMQRGNMDESEGESRRRRSMNLNPGGGRRIARVGILEGMNFLKIKNMVVFGGWILENEILEGIKFW